MILLLLVGVFFIFSAYSKIWQDDAITQFQWKFLDLGITSNTTAAILARLFIGIEILLGLFFIAHIYLKQVTYPFALFMLGAFSIYLVYIIATQGNNGDCGCFGTVASMKPLPSLLKNIVAIIVVVALMYIYPAKPYKNQEWIAVSIAMVALVSPFVMRPLNTSSDTPEVVSQPIDLSPLYKLSPAPSVDLMHGKHIVAFLSYSCPHCKKTGFLLHTIHHAHPDIPIFLVVNGSAIYKKSFYDETHAADVPQIEETNTEDFKQLAGTFVPAIYWVNNGVIERKASYYQLDPQYMQDWAK